MSDDRHGWSEPGVEQVAPNAFRIPLPLPGDGLRAVNVYALTTPGGVTLIDGGWALPESQETLEAALGQLDLDLGSIERFLVTHAHRDHYELASKLGQLLGSRVELGIGERPSIESIVSRAGRHDDSPLNARLRAGGAAEIVTEIEAARASNGDDRSELLWRLPDRWLEDRDVLVLENRQLEVLATPGHTRGHVVFVDHDAGLLFSGDHLLPHITPSIGFETIPSGSALTDYLASLALVRGLPDLAMLPAHGPARASTHGRIDELVEHHESRLQRMLASVERGASTAFEVACDVPWTRRDVAFSTLDVFNRMLAVNETMAHLEDLNRRELVAATMDADGIARYAV
ncbi:MAG: MBL fold metallo-hydrolase [Nitriliruptor sp.]|nr:MAG: MBL fold metallo-hydrolase [Nitriliruptor sp.]